MASLWGSIDFHSFHTLSFFRAAAARTGADSGVLDTYVAGGGCTAFGLDGRRPGVDLHTSRPR